MPSFCIESKFWLEWKVWPLGPSAPCWLSHRDTTLPCSHSGPRRTPTHHKSIGISGTVVNVISQWGSEERLPTILWAHPHCSCPSVPADFPYKTQTQRWHYWEFQDRALNESRALPSAWPWVMAEVACPQSQLYKVSTLFKDWWFSVSSFLHTAPAPTLLISLLVTRWKSLRCTWSQAYLILLLIFG